MTGGANRNRPDLIIKGPKLKAQTMTKPSLNAISPIDDYFPDEPAEDVGPVPLGADLDALMARGRRLRSEAFIDGFSRLFNAPGNSLKRASKSDYVPGARTQKA
ncbi:MAG: hypothetical protein AAF556_12665 [Pseudomonadota bacterium]